MNYLSAAIAVGLFVAVCSCQPSPLRTNVVPNPTCETHCTVLRKLGCSEGLPSKRGTSCESVCERMLKTKASDPKVACTSAATDIVSLRACGSVDCE